MSDNQPRQHRNTLESRLRSSNPLTRSFAEAEARQREAEKLRLRPRAAGPGGVAIAVPASANGVVTGTPTPAASPARAPRVVNANPPATPATPAAPATPATPATPANPVARVRQPVTPGRNQPNTPGARNNRKALRQYAQANGNMSVARRLAVIKPALIKYGYSPQDAEKIALAAPLSTSMYNDRAIAVSLEYAESLSQPLPAGTPNVQQVQRGPVIPMPQAAQNALTEYREKQVPVPNKARQAVQKNTSRVVSAIVRAIKPATDRVGNLPVPGGLGTLFLVNLLFLFLIVPSNSQGYTRAQLLWLTLLNLTKMPNTPPKDAIPASPLVQAMFGIATGIQETAVAVASLGQEAQSITNTIENPGKAIQKSLSNIPVIGGILGVGAPLITGGLLSANGTVAPPAPNFVPPASAGGDGPPPPPIIGTF